MAPRGKLGLRRLLSHAQSKISRQGAETQSLLDVFLPWRDADGESGGLRVAVLQPLLYAEVLRTAISRGRRVPCHAPSGYRVQASQRLKRPWTSGVSRVRL